MQGQIKVLKKKDEMSIEKIRSLELTIEQMEVNESSSHKPSFDNMQEQINADLE
jgi:hypothetical protein